MGKISMHSCGPFLLLLLLLCPWAGRNVGKRVTDKVLVVPIANISIQGGEVHADKS